MKWDLTNDLYDVLDPVGAQRLLVQFFDETLLNSDCTLNGLLQIGSQFIELVLYTGVESSDEFELRLGVEIAGLPLDSRLATSSWNVGVQPVKGNTTVSTQLQK